MEGLQLATKRNPRQVMLEHQLQPDDNEQQKPPTPSLHNTILISADRSLVAPDDTIPETIIHFSNDIPVLSLISFSSTTGPPSYRDSPTTDNDKAIDVSSVDRSQDSKDGRTTLKQRMSLSGGSERLESHGDESQQLPDPYHQWVRNSNQTLTNGIVERSEEHERIDIRDPAPDSRMSTTYSRVPFAPTEARSDSSPWITDGVHSRKLVIDGAADHPRKHPSPSLCHTSSRVKTFPSSKRYVDPRAEKKARKAAFKTATTLFSNERTFTHWIKFAMLLGSLAIILLNFSGVGAHFEMDQELANRAGRIGQNVGVSLMILCLLCLIYASSTYHWRHLGVAGGKHDDRYFDRIGPTLLTLGLLVTYAINVVCK